MTFCSLFVHRTSQKNEYNDYEIKNNVKLEVPLIFKIDIMRKIPVFIAFMLLTRVLFAQNKYNQIDSNGLKQGLWVSDYPAERVETNYYNGQRHGICVAYSRMSNKISSIGEFRNNVMSGTWYMFDDYGILLYKVVDIVENKDNYSFADGTHYYGGKPKHKAHFVNYYPNGNVESEGIILFSDSFESESSQYGMWNYYDDKGNLIKSEEIKGVKRVMEK